MKSLRSIFALTYLIVLLSLAVAAAVAQDVLRCDYCNRLITGEYVVSDGQNYHVDCYESHIAPRCALCGEIIEGEYFEDNWGNLVHAKHKGQVPQCLYCRRFISDQISDGMVRYDDGRIVCGICARNAINDIKRAEHIMEDLQASLAGYGIETRDEDIPLSLVGRNSMPELAQGFHADPLGFAYYEKTTYAGGLITNRSYKIYILNGLPRFEFISSLAHELMHIWLYRNAPIDLDATLREGTCNFAAYLILQDYSGREVQFVIDNLISDPNPVYGDGFRKVKAYTDKNGLSDLLKYLKSHRTPPW